MVSTAGSRGDARPETSQQQQQQQQHRRSKSAVDDFHHGLVKRLAGILDDHSTAIKRNSDFLRDITSTLRTHSYYPSLPRPVSEPALKTDVVSTPESDENSVDSSPGFMPPTPPDTPTVEVTDWSYLPEKTGHNALNTEKLGVTNTSEPKANRMERPASSMTTTTERPASSMTTSTLNSSPEEPDITKWYRFHAVRAGKNLRYDCREVDMKLSRFIRRLNDLNGELQALNQSDCMPNSSSSSTATKSNKSIDAARRQFEIRDAVQQEFASMRQTLNYYRKERATSIDLAATKADDIMPGFSGLESAAKQRALYELYRRNKDISKPGDRKRYNDTMVLMDACIAKELNEEFVDKIDNWEAQVENMKAEYAGSCIV